MKVYLVTGGVVSGLGKRNYCSVFRQTSEMQRAEGGSTETGSVHQHRSGNHGPLSARGKFLSLKTERKTISIWDTTNVLSTKT